MARTIFNPRDRDELLQRLDRLEPGATARWGTMTAQRMLCHLSDSLRVGLGETPAQFNFLKAHGCEEAQGYLIAHPLSESELRSWWRIQEDLHQSSDRQADLWQSAD